MDTKREKHKRIRTAKTTSPLWWRTWAPMAWTSKSLALLNIHVRSEQGKGRKKVLAGWTKHPRSQWLNLTFNILYGQLFFLHPFKYFGHATIENTAIHIEHCLGYISNRDGRVGQFMYVCAHMYESVYARKFVFSVLIFFFIIHLPLAISSLFPFVISRASSCSSWRALGHA